MNLATSHMSWKLDGQFDIEMFQKWCIVFVWSYWFDRNTSYDWESVSGTDIFLCSLVYISLYKKLISSLFHAINFTFYWITSSWFSHTKRPFNFSFSNVLYKVIVSYRCPNIFPLLFSLPASLSPQSSMSSSSLVLSLSSSFFLSFSLYSFWSRFMFHNQETNQLS